MSSGIRAGLEIRDSAAMPHAIWIAVAPSIEVDEVPNRTVFTLLAGYPSRWGLEPLIPLRGLPPDLTPPIQDLYDEWGGSAFDASWVSYQELAATVERLTTTIEVFAKDQGHAEQDVVQLHRGISIDAVIAFLGVYHTRGFATRMVFWFTPI
jgi:hypothetical protein